MRALIASICFGVVSLTAPSLWALQAEETKTESQAETEAATDAKADDKKADDKDAKAKDTKKKAEGEEEAEADKKKKDEVKENADAAQAELEKAEVAAPAVEVAPEAPVAEPAPALEVAPAAPVAEPVVEAAPASEAAVTTESDAEVKAEEDKEAEKKALPWAGSSVVFGTNSDLATFIKPINEQYNPTVKNSIKLRPSWVLNKQYSLSGNLGLTCELFTTPGSADGSTNVTTCSVSNLSIAASLGELYNIYDVSIRGRVALSLPTNTLTREMGGLYGINAGVSATRKFDELGGLSLTYSFGMSHDGTKALYGMDIADERSGDRIVAPRISEAPLPDTVPVESNYGAAAALGFSNGLSASYTATDWLSLSGSFSFENTLLDSAAGEQYDGELEGARAASARALLDAIGGQGECCSAWSGAVCAVK